MNCFTDEYAIQIKVLSEEYCGIRLCWDACARYRCYGIDELRGGRLFELRESDSWHITTRMIRMLELL